MLLTNKRARGENCENTAVCVKIAAGLLHVDLFLASRLFSTFVPIYQCLPNEQMVYSMSKFAEKVV
jgi:hypothetical protein